MYGDVRLKMAVKDILNVLDYNKGKTYKEISEETSLSYKTVSKACKRLELGGYINITGNKHVITKR